MFYNTGIATYIWVLSNRKAERRQGCVQLIDATQWHTPLRRNLGSKNCELSEEDIGRICDAFLNFEESEQSKIFPNEAFGYRKVTVERPAANRRRRPGTGVQGRRATETPQRRPARSGRRARHQEAASGRRGTRPAARAVRHHH